MISEEYPKGHPQVVQPAIQQARNLIRNLQRAETGLPLQPFIYQNKGSMATIGRNHAVVELKKLRFGGFSGMGCVAIHPFDEYCGCKEPSFHLRRLDVELLYL